VTVNVSMALRNFITACGALVLLFLSSWKLTLMMLAVVPIIVGAGMLSFFIFFVVISFLYYICVCSGFETILFL
jgi:hypothetical protein